MRRSWSHRLWVAMAATGIAMTGLAGASAWADTAPKRVKVTGEIIDTWCQVSGVMGIALGSAHHQCAIWCAVGGIPVGIMGDDGRAYVLLKTDSTGMNVKNPTVIDLQTDHVTVDADLYERDGVSYLVVAKILSDDGIINLNHKDLGILPFGE